MNFTYSHFLLILLIIAWVVTLIIYQCRKKVIDAGTILLASYAGFAVFSLLLYNGGQYTFLPLNLLPFILLYILEMMGMYPILKFDTVKVTSIKKPNMTWFYLISWFFIVCSLIHLPSSLAHAREGITMILLDPNGGQELYLETNASTVDSGGGISNIFAIFAAAFSGIGILLFFFSLTLDKPNKITVIGLLLSCLMRLVTGVASGQRGMVVEPLLVMIITYFGIHRYIKPKYNKIAKIMGIVVIVLVTIPLVAITMSRFDNKLYDPLESVYFYAGQQNLYFNNYALDDNGIRYGDRIIPLFKRMVGCHDVPKNFWERRLKYPSLYVNDEVFYTYVGDFMIDFGVLATILIFILGTVLFTDRTRPKNGQIQLHQLILLQFLMYLCMSGGLKLYPFSDVAGNLKVIVYFASYLCFKHFPITFKHKRKKSSGESGFKESPELAEAVEE